MIAFRILGPIEVYLGDERLPVGGRRQLCLLAVLLLHANEPVSTDRLIEALWVGGDRLGAAKRLQVSITRLRTALGRGPGRDGVLDTTAGGYLLHVGPEALDADVFRNRVEAGRRELADGRPDLSATTLRRADALWRGPPLAEVAYEPFAQADVLALEELRLSAIEARVDAELALGEHRALVPELEGLVSRHATREHMAGQLMTALYRSGRQTEALEVYRRVRVRLADELGLNPGPALEALQGQVLAQSPSLSLASPSPAAEPRSVSAAASADRPLPAVLRVRPATSFVGRRDERERVETAWSAATRGERRLVLLGGEPGIGKTRLAVEFAADVAARGATVLYGRSGEDVGLPYEPWRQVLGQLVEAVPQELLREHVERHGGELMRLAPGLASRVAGVPPPQEADAETERYLLFGATQSVLQTVACQSPVLLVLDDLHWAGRPTLALLKHLQVTAPPMALLVLATYRDPGIPPGHALTELLGDLHREPGVERIVLGGLGEPQVRELVETTIGHELSSAVAVRVAELCRETDGNPFFLAETVRALQESGAVSVDADGRWVQLAAFELPGSVREVIRGRIARLGERGAHLLRHAAVIGREFDLGLLAEVAKVQPDAALDELERAELAAIVAEQPDAPGGYAFVHALVKHAVEDQLSTSRRARVHRRVAEALEQRSGEDDSAIGDLARHWAAADGLNARAKASHYAVLAGRAALAQLAPDAALAWFRRAMALHDAGPAPAASESLELLLGLGEAQLHAGHPEFRETLLEAGRTAQLVGDNERLVRAALANSRGYFSSAGVVDDQRVAVLQAALDGTAPEDPCRARLLALLAAELIWSPEHERRSALCDEALALARAREDPAALAHVLTMRVTAVWWPETLQERLAVTAELLERSETLSDPVQRFWALVWRAVTVAQSGELAEADRCHAAMHELTERLRHPRLDFVLATQDGWRAQLAGRLEEAERLAGRALEIGTLAGEPDAQSLYAAQLCPLRWQQGRLAELAEALGAITQAVPGVSAFRALRALSEYEAGRPDGARSLLRDEAQGGFSGLSHDPVMLGALTLWGELAARTGDDPISAVLLARVEPLREQVVLDSLGALGAVSRTAGLLAASLGLVEAADAHFAHALGLHERFHASSLAARTRLEWGLAMVGREGRGESARGRDLLQSALTVAAGHGLAGLEERCRAALDRPPQAPPPAVGPTTRRAAAARRG